MSLKAAINASTILSRSVAISGTDDQNDDPFTRVTLVAPVRKDELDVTIQLNKVSNCGKIRHKMFSVR